MSGDGGVTVGMEYQINGGAWTSLGTTGGGGASGTYVTVYWPGGNAYFGTTDFTFSTEGTYNFRLTYSGPAVSILEPTLTPVTVTPLAIPALNGSLTGYSSTAVTGTVVTLNGTVNAFDATGVAAFLGTTVDVASQAVMYARLFYKSPDGIWHNPGYSPVNVSSLTNSSVITTNRTIPLSQPGIYEWYLAGGASTNLEAQLSTGGTVGTVTKSGNTSLKCTWSDLAMQPKEVLRTGTNSSNQSWSQQSVDFSDNTQPAPGGPNAVVMNFGYQIPLVSVTHATKLGNIESTAMNSVGTCTLTLPYACTVGIWSYVVMPGGNWNHQGEVSIDNTMILDANTTNVPGFVSYLGYQFSDCFPGPGPFSRYAMKSGNGYGSDLTGLTSISIGNFWRRMNIDLAAGTHTVRVTRPGGYVGGAGFHPQFLNIYIPLPTNAGSGASQDIVIASGTTTVSEPAASAIQLATVGSGTLTGILHKKFSADIQTAGGSTSDFVGYLSGVINNSNLDAAAKADLISGLNTAATQISEGNTNSFNTTYGVYSFLGSLGSYLNLQIQATDSTAKTSFSSLAKSDLISLTATAATDSKLALIIPDNSSLTLIDAVPNFSVSTAGVPAVSTADVAAIASGTITATFQQKVSDPGATSALVVNEVAGSIQLSGTAAVKMSEGTFGGVTGASITIGNSSSATVTVTVPAGYAATTPWTAQGATLTQLTNTSAQLTNIGSGNATQPAGDSVSLKDMYAYGIVRGGTSGTISQSFTLTKNTKLTYSMSSLSIQSVDASLWLHTSDGSVSATWQYGGGFSGTASGVVLPPGSYTLLLTPNGGSLPNGGARGTITNIALTDANSAQLSSVVVNVPCVAVSGDLTLTVHSGSKTTTYSAPTNTTIPNIQADTLAGKSFNAWTVSSGDATVLIGDGSPTSVRMGSTNAEITATFAGSDSLTPKTQYVYAGPHANKTMATLDWNLPSAKSAAYPTVRWIGSNMSLAKFTPAPLLTTQTSGTAVFGDFESDQIITLAYIYGGSVPPLISNDPVNSVTQMDVMSTAQLGGSTIGYVYTTLESPSGIIYKDNGHLPYTSSLGASQTHVILKEVGVWKFHLYAYSGNGPGGEAPGYPLLITVK